MWHLEAFKGKVTVFKQFTDLDQASRSAAYWRSRGYATTLWTT